MTPLDPIQAGVALLLFSLPESTGFAIAGGVALLAHGTIDRPTRDIDAFAAAQPGPTPGDVTELATALHGRLVKAGWHVTVIRDRVSVWLVTSG